MFFFLQVPLLQLSNPIQELEFSVLRKKTIEGQHSALKSLWTSHCHWLNSILGISTAASAIALAAVEMPPNAIFINVQRSL